MWRTRRSTVRATAEDPLRIDQMTWTEGSSVVAGRLASSGRTFRAQCIALDTWARRVSNNRDGELDLVMRLRLP